MSSQRKVQKALRSRLLHIAAACVNNFMSTKCLGLGGNDENLLQKQCEYGISVIVNDNSENLLNEFYISHSQFASI